MLKSRKCFTIFPVLPTKKYISKQEKITEQGFNVTAGLELNYGIHSVLYWDRNWPGPVDL